MSTVTDRGVVEPIQHLEWFSGCQPCGPLTSVRKQNSLHLFLKKTLQVAGSKREFHRRTLGFGKQLFQNVLHYSHIEWGERVPLVPISWLVLENPPCLFVLCPIS